MIGIRSLDSRGGQRFFSLVLPAYNPGLFIKNTLEQIDSFIDRQFARWEIVFVCDGCTDDSPMRLRNWRPGDPNIRVVSYQPNRGKGYAVRQGLLAARAPYRIFTDVDLAYGFDDINRVAERLTTGDPVVIASRTHPESRVTLPVVLQGYAYRRQIQSQFFARLVQWLLPLSLGDTQAGLKGIAARVANEIVPSLTCDGFGFDCELLTACVRRGVPITEVPVSVRLDNAGSTTGGRATIRMIRDLWRIRRNWKGQNTHPLHWLGVTREAG